MEPRERPSAHPEARGAYLVHPVTASLLHSPQLQPNPHQPGLDGSTPAYSEQSRMARRLGRGTPSSSPDNGDHTNGHEQSST